jgi:hypothetical protein
MSAANAVLLLHGLRTVLARSEFLGASQFAQERFWIWAPEVLRSTGDDRTAGGCSAALVPGDDAKGWSLPEGPA